MSDNKEGEVSQKSFNIASVSVVVMLFLQFGGVVWYASQLNAKVLELGLKVDRLEVTQREDTARANPIIYGFNNLVVVINDLKNDIKELKKEYKSK